MKNFLAVDLGATSGRTVLATYDGERVEMKEWTRFKNPQIPMTGHIFWDLPHLYNEILVAIKKTVDEGIAVHSIGIDTWGCDFAFFGKQGQLLGLPFCYRDSHTDGAIEAFTSIHMNADALYQRTGIQFMPFNSLFQLDTMRRTGITVLSAADKVMFIPDALSYMLTGQCVCEYTVASTSQLLNAQTGDLDEHLLRFVNLQRKQFGRLVQPGEHIGYLSEQVQQATGAGPIPVVAVAGHDTASAVVSIPAADDDYAYLSCGTWSLLGIESPHAIITSESRTENFTNEGGLDGTYRFLKNICGLWIFENCRKEWGDTVPTNVNELNALSMTSSYDELINPDDQIFAHPQSMTQAICTYLRNHDKPLPQCPADYVRCIFRSLANRYCEVLNILARLSGKTFKSLHVIGGGSLNTFLMQFTADAVGLPVIAGPAEGTALGNVLVQLRSAGEVASTTEMRQISLRSVETKTYSPNPISN